ncbi:MAG TPA: acyltransferase [Cytophagales bacterium]|nr:acyltransferase [Cytophagales bacterium]HAP61682.1 acyltransferase [Cytophagales bacterium]
METSRRYDIDWLRVIAIGLLVIYHIAIVFQPWAMFIGFIRSDTPWEGLWTPMTLLNVWRIPFLFFVSGMGVYFAMRKRNVVQLLLDRAKRIALPYVFGLLAIVPLHFLIFQQYYGLPSGYQAHPGHLWFLGNLIIYVSCFFAFFFRMMKNPEGKFRKTLMRIMSNPLGPLAVAVFFVLEVLLVQPQIFAQYAQTLHGYAIGAVAFFFGFLFVYTGKPFWDTVLRWRWLYAAGAVGLYSLRITTLETNTLMAVESVFWILSIFGFGYRYLNKPSRALTYLSQAAYPVYIIHMFVLYGAASIVLPWPIPVPAQFALIVAFSMVGCWALYEFVIRRIPILRPLFGLSFTPKQVKKKPEVPVTTQPV